MTKQENVFINEMVKTGDKVYSATKAGYKHVETNAFALAAKPAIDAEIQARVRARLYNVGAQVAVDTLIQIAQDAKMPANARVNAADKILSHMRRDGEATEEKEPHELTGEEIANRLARTYAQAAALETIAAGRARVVEAIEEPIGEAIEAIGEAIEEPIGEAIEEPIGEAPNPSFFD